MYYIKTCTGVNKGPVGQTIKKILVKTHVATVLFEKKFALKTLMADRGKIGKGDPEVVAKIVMHAI